MTTTTTKTITGRARATKSASAAETVKKRAITPMPIKKKIGARAGKKKSVNDKKRSVKPNKTAITLCVQEELRRYYDMLDGEDPTNVYHLVMHQAEHALIDSVMRECGGNQSKATKWLGISRGTLRNKLAEMGYD